MANPTKEDVDAAERALLHALPLARAAVRRIVEQAPPEDNSDAAEDRVSATERMAAHLGISAR
jgi:hypothetical protein